MQEPKEETEITLKFRTFGFAESSLHLDNKKEKGIFFLYFARFALPLASPKVLSLDNKKEKGIFFLYCAHLIVPLQRNIKQKTV